MSLLVEAVQAHIGATERWPDDVKLFQQYQVEQITFPDYAACLSVKTYLHMCGLKFTTELKINAEEMSPSGRVPFIQLGPFLVSEMEPIIACVQTRGFNLSAELPDIQKSELKAYMALVGNTLVNAEHYLAWVHTEVSEQVTKPRYGSMHPWPLDKILPLKKQLEVKQRLASVEWANKTFDEVCDEVLTCCQALSERLDKQDFFFGKRPLLCDHTATKTTLKPNTFYTKTFIFTCSTGKQKQLSLPHLPKKRPTELDALVFGHLFTLLTTDLPNREFALIIRRFENLVQFCERVDQTYYKTLSNDY